MRLLCTVRACGERLDLEGRTWTCANGHSFDTARSGYVNLLQPQDKRSKNPGDTSEAVAARRRFLDAGHAAPLVDRIVDAVPMRSGQPLLDVGCGEGHHLAAFRGRYDVEACGTDISIPAIDLAARRHSDCQWVVANADRFLPYPDGAFATVMSITARMNAPEFRRVLAADGTLLIVLPGPDDLIELREAVLGERVERDRAERTVAEFTPLFALQSRDTLRHVARLDRSAIADVMSSSYRGLRARERERLENIGSMDVTLSRDLLLFR